MQITISTFESQAVVSLTLTKNHRKNNFMVRSNQVAYEDMNSACDTLEDVEKIALSIRASELEMPGNDCKVMTEAVIIRQIQASKE